MCQLAGQTRAYQRRAYQADSEHVVQDLGKGRSVSSGVLWTLRCLGCPLSLRACSRFVDSLFRRHVCSRLCRVRRPLFIEASAYEGGRVQWNAAGGLFADGTLLQGPLLASRSLTELWSIWVLPPKLRSVR